MKPAGETIDDLMTDKFFHLDQAGNQSLANEWRTLAGKYGATPSLIDSSLSDLLRRYNARGRHYHNSSHVAALLRQGKRHRIELSEPATVQFAIWFHDVIYRTRHHDNELRSADYAAAVLLRLQVPPPMIDDVATLIRATQTHQLNILPTSLHHDGSWFLDFDLAILGSRPEVYRAYAQAIRREYFWVPSFLFRKKRRAILENFLQRPQLFFTETMRVELEKNARENLSAELAALQ